MYALPIGKPDGAVNDVTIPEGYPLAAPPLPEGVGKLSPSTTMLFCDPIETDAGSSLIIEFVPLPDETMLMALVSLKASEADGWRVIVLESIART